MPVKLEPVNPSSPFFGALDVSYRGENLGRIDPSLKVENTFDGVQPFEKALTDIVHNAYAAGFAAGGDKLADQIKRKLGID